MAEDFYKTLGVSRDASAADIQKATASWHANTIPICIPTTKTRKKNSRKCSPPSMSSTTRPSVEQYDRYGSSFESAGAGGPRATWSWGRSAGGARRTGGSRGYDFSQIFGDRSEAKPPAALLTSSANLARPRGDASAPPPASQSAVPIWPPKSRFPSPPAVLGGEVQLSLRRASGETETIVVKIPVGIDEGKKIRLRGQGEPAPSRGGTAGDILITVHVGTHPFFSRRGTIWT